MVKFKQKQTKKPNPEWLLLRLQFSFVYLIQVDLVGTLLTYWGFQVNKLEFFLLYVYSRGKKKITMCRFWRTRGNRLSLAVTVAE